MKRGSFTQNVKDEIASSPLEEEALLPLLAGFVRANGILEEGKIFLTTENSKIAKLLYRSFQSVFHVTPSFTYSKKMKLDKCVVYHLAIDDDDRAVLQTMQLEENGQKANPKGLLADNLSLRSFITGVFLASGSVNSPKSENYHLQMIVADEADAKFVIKCLNRFHNERNMDSKMIKRRNKYVVYIKKADQIANFLRVINASVALMDFENVRIEKDFVNSDNRYQICFNANYQKTLAKSQEQLEDIRTIEKTIGLQNLDEKEKAVAEIRLENNDIPLSQIADILREKYGLILSKSSVNRVFASIHETAKRYGGSSR